jgi:hypothetical protein
VQSKKIGWPREGLRASPVLPVRALAKVP